MNFDQNEQFSDKILSNACQKIVRLLDKNATNLQKIDRILSKICKSDKILSLLIEEKISPKNMQSTQRLETKEIEPFSYLVI